MNEQKTAAEMRKIAEQHRDELCEPYLNKIEKLSSAGHTTIMIGPSPREREAVITKLKSLGYTVEILTYGRLKVSW